MDRYEISEVLMDEFNTDDPSNVPVSDRWRLYERFKISLQNKLLSPDEYTKEILNLSEILDL